MSTPSYITAGTLAQLATLTNIGTEADTLTNTHCPSNYTSVNSSQYGTVCSGHLTTVYSSNYSPNNTSQYGSVCNGHLTVVNSSLCTPNNTSVNSSVNSLKYGNYSGRVTYSTRHTAQNTTYVT